MATAGLTRAAHRWRLPVGLRSAWLWAYAAIWTATLVDAVLVSLLATTAKTPMRHLLGHCICDPTRRPRAAMLLHLVAHNVPIASWPILLGVLGAHRNRRGRKLADAVLLGCIFANTLPMGAALGAYGARLLPYIPQLPIEWAGLALGASAWLLQRRRALTVPEGLALLALTACVLLCAAVIETVAVPHR